MKRNRKQMTETPLAGAVVGALLAALGGCTQPPIPDSEAGEDDRTTPTAAKLFALVNEADPYLDWAQFPDVQGTVPSTAPHGPMARIFINALVEESLDDFDGALLDGAIIVKENLGESTSEKADALTIMWKVSGFDPENNDWFWANITPDGEVNAEGKIEGCINCHTAARANDFIFLHEF